MRAPEHIAANESYIPVRSELGSRGAANPFQTADDEARPKPLKMDIHIRVSGLRINKINKPTIISCNIENDCTACVTCFGKTQFHRPNETDAREEWVLLNSNNVPNFCHFSTQCNRRYEGCKRRCCLRPQVPRT